MEYIQKKRPPFIYGIHTNEEIDGARQMANSLLHIPQKTL
jgi:hypothetical protein